MAYSKGNYDGPNGVHGVPLWRIAGYALNNTASNLYLLMMMNISFYLTGFVGAGMVLAGSFSMIMRLWDGVTDPIVGMLVDKTNGKFGKNRPFMVIGNVILFVTSFIMFRVTPMIPDGFKLPWFFLINAVYYVGYTCQCVVTKSAQSCITNDPKQRPLFAIFDGTYNGITFAVGQMWISGALVPKYGQLASQGLFNEMQLVLGLISLVFTIIAVISLAPKDNAKYFGTGQNVKVGIKDYVDVIAHNRAIQMLVLSASTDKLGTQAKTGAATMILYGIVAGNFALSGGMNLYTTIFNLVFLFLGLGVIATKMGQKKAMVIGSVGAVIGNILMMLLWFFGDATTLSLPGIEGFTGFNFFSIALFLLTIVTGGLQNISANIVIPMTADCADYETYRSGKYVPGLMGTLFSFVDKLVSSLAPMIASLMLAAIGFKEAMPDVGTPLTPELKFVGIFLTYGLVAIGCAINLIAMKFYPLNKEMMEQIQEKIAAIKAGIKPEEQAAPVEA